MTTCVYSCIYMYIYTSICIYTYIDVHMAMGQYPVLSRAPPPPSVTNPCRAGCFKPLSRGIAGAPPILLTGMLRNSKQADTLRFHEGECAKYRKKMRVQQAVNPEASIVQERGLGFKV